ncbi:MAG: sulfotransferase [Alphaproteobacteria bacterium]|nr:sulfotransferase [Alphaproteobacteria bacterium]
MRDDQGRAFPDFVCVGTYKAATTWLFRVMDEHPGVFVPDVKEVHFFNVRSGLDAYVEKGLDWYSGLYASAPEGAVLGDVTPGYLACPVSAERIAATMPDARILVMLRDPASRAHSHFWYRAGMDGARASFDDTIRGWRDDPQDIVAHGLYATHLQRYLDRFPAEHVKVVLVEDLKSDPQGTWRDICRFVGADPSFVPPSLVEAQNTARSFRWKRLYKLNGAVARFLYLNGGDRLRRAIKRTGVPTLLDRLNRKPAENPRLTADQRARLLDVYLPEIERLEGMLGRDLGAWKQGAR